MFFSKERFGENTGAIKPTLESPSFIIKDVDGAFLFVKIFTKGGGKKYNAVAVNKNESGEEYISSVHIKRDSSLLNKIRKGGKLFQPQSGLSDEVKPQNNLPPLSEDKDRKEKSTKQDVENRADALKGLSVYFCSR